MNVKELEKAGYFQLGTIAMGGGLNVEYAIEQETKLGHLCVVKDDYVMIFKKGKQKR